MKTPFARGSGPTILIATAILALAIWLRPSLPGAFGTILIGLLFPLWALILYFFRDPERAIPTEKGMILAPADGQVVSIETVHEPIFVQENALRISIFMSILDVHVNRSPIAGEVKMVRHVPGKFLQAFRPEASDVNEHILMGLQAGPSRQVLVKQIAGIIARRCVNLTAVGDHLEIGQRFGLIRFSSRVDLYLPTDISLLTRVGDKVHGGTTILAKW